MRPKVSVIGAGNVGATTAMLVALEALAHVFLFDLVEGMPQGKALDIAEACPLWGSPVKAWGSNRLEDTRESDIVVITAGLARKPGMSRDDLLHANAEIVGAVAKKLPEYSPNAILLIVTNPMDVMAHLSWKLSGLPSERVIGMGGILDSARFRTFLAWEAGTHPGQVEAMVLGGHGDQMVPVESLIKVNGKPIKDVLPQEKIDAIIERTRHGGAEIVSLLKTGSAYYAPAASTVEMVRAILKDEKTVLPCAALLKGEYGSEGVYAGVPVVLGRGGVEDIIEVPLHTGERIAFNNSVHAVRELLSKLKDIE